MSTPPVVNYGVGGYGVVSTSGGGGGGGGGGGSPYIPVGGQNLAIPGLIYPSEADLKQFDGVAEFISPFTGQEEEQSFLDQHWELDLTWPEMTWEQFAPLQAWTGALHGKSGTFVWGPPLATSPRGLGTAAGAPTCVGTDLVGSNVLTLQGWTPSTTGVLLPGDFLSLYNAETGYRLYQYVGILPLSSNGGGNASAAIFPSLRDVPAAGQAVILTNPLGTFRLAENRRSAPAKKTKTFTLSLKCREAVSLGAIGSYSGGGGGNTPGLITFLTLNETGGTPQNQLLINVETLPLGFLVDVSVNINGITNQVDLNNQTAPIISTGTNAQGPYMIIGPFTGAAAAYPPFSVEADTGTAAAAGVVGPALITFLTLLSVDVGGTDSLTVNVESLPSGAVVGANVNINGITNQVDLNNQTAPIISTGTNAQGPYMIIGPFTGAAAAYPPFSVEADTGTATVV